jgi:D-alanyl-D-alanine carboxypeptidase (penicillin-binding protein 5/6)
MPIHAPRRTNNASPFAHLLALFLGVGLLCGVGGRAEASTRDGFLFHDYGARPHLTPPDEIKARGALLVEARTGEVLYARNPDEHLLPASTTKLMTALIVYEKIGMRGNVTIVEDDTRVEPSSVPLIPGETVSVNKLFHALLIESANDSARALGRYVAGTTNAFVQMMNERALAMGLFNTHFYNPNGLPAPSGTHYTSCADLMRIFRAVIAHPELRAICSTKEYRLTTEAKTQILRNHNRLLGVYPGMGPAKTGWTVASQHTYAASVTRNGRELLLTLLDSPNKWRDAEILFNWGFAQRPSVAGIAGETTFPAPTVTPAPGEEAATVSGAAPVSTISLAPPIPADNAYQHGNR